MFSHHRMTRTRRPTIVRLHHSIVATGILNTTPHLERSSRRLPFLALALSAFAYIAWRAL